MLRITVNFWPLFSSHQAHLWTRTHFCALLHVCAQQCEEPLSCSGHFLLDRSQREQLSMRVTQMIDSLLCGASKAIWTQGHSLRKPLSSPAEFISSILSQIKRRLCQCHFHYKPIAGTARGARQLLSWKQISSTTQQNLPMGKPWNGLSVFKHPHSFLYFSLLFSTSPVLWSKL